MPSGAYAIFAQGYNYMKSFYVASLLLAASLSPALAQVGGAGMSGPGAGVAGMMSDGSNATLPTARYELGANNACNPVTDFGADPTGVANAATAINSCAAVTKNGKRVNIYLPAGVYYITNTIALSTGQTLYCDNRATTVISVDQNFNPAATGVITLSGGSLDPGPSVVNCDITFAQPSDQGTRANFADLGVCTSGTGGTGCKYPPAIKALTSSTRYKVQDVRIARAWNGIDSTGINAVWWLDNVEMSALNIGLNITQGLDFSHINGFHFWDFDINSATALYTGVYSDGNTYAAKFGEVNGIDVRGFTSFKGRIEINSSGFWGQFSNLALDGDNATLEIVENGNPGVQITNVYSTGVTNGGASGKCKIDIGASARTVIINNLAISGSSTTPFCLAAGTVSVIGATIRGNDPNAKLITGTGGSLAIRGSTFTGGNGWTVPLVETTNTTTILVGNTWPVSGTNTGSFKINTDLAGNYVADNNTKNWQATVPSGVLGYYDLGDQLFTPTITPSFVTPGDSTFPNLASTAAYFRRGNFVEGYSTTNFDTNAYTTASGDFQITATMPAPIVSGNECNINLLSVVTIAYTPGCNIGASGANALFKFPKTNSNAAATNMGTTEVPASKTSVSFRWAWRYRIR